MSRGGAFTSDVAVVGGCGHVGLPLAIAFADRGLSVRIYDIDEDAVAAVNRGQLPFHEDGAAEPLRRALAHGRLTASAEAASVEGAENVVVVIGTPVDEHLNPDPVAVRHAIMDCAPYLSDGQLLVLRSTVYPGVTASVEAMVRELGRDMDVAFCPERIAQGAALRELVELPQIVGARTERAAERAEALFRVLTDSVLRVSPEEAELAKLFTNTWRYIKFAIANQFFMMANDYGLDYERIRAVIRENYPRAADLPGAGFAAGPCLLKDTMQLAAFTNNSFVLGHSAMLVNEGLPLYLISRLERRFDLATMSLGILGMAFKPGTDDTRDSLSYKLRRIARFRAREVLCTDERVTTDPTLLPLEEVLERADVLVIATPHPEYRDFETSKPVVDIWNLRGGGTVV
ncbi:MAG: nucleotide sugar dehydrogenase [Mycolicibacterium hassiacum]|uniref:nucleotide sugar dehydrogenase n=1 Tax=Mycolicibacterium hassiacum TaxID=46351 RepID=UPI0023F683C0|nr:nucleotide sugar dehydrogenase [Mycolicibacterium hassiacum]MBX5488215.1 nucleotide sugar dehydrogenase [Mycolicibacterium hassiacum]